MGKIYKIEGPLNLPDECKIYVGMTTTSLDLRWNKHKASFNQYLLSEDGKGFCTTLFKSFKQYSINNFNISLLEECDIDDLYKKEVYWTLKLNSIYPNGYNILIGYKYNLKSIDLPEYINYCEIPDSKGNMYHGYRIRHVNAKKCRVILIPINEQLTDSMLEDAKEYLQLVITNYKASLLNPNYIPINIPNLSVKRNDASKGLPEFINYITNGRPDFKATRHGYIVKHQLSGNERSFMIPINELLTDDMLEDAIVYKEDVLELYKKSLLDPSIDPKIPTPSYRKNEESIGLPDYVSYYIKKINGVNKRHGYRLSHRPSSTFRDILTPFGQPITDNMLEEITKIQKKVLDDYKAKLLEESLKKLEIQNK